MEVGWALGELLLKGMTVMEVSYRAFNFILVEAQQNLPFFQPIALEKAR
jgi:hypothetical protein